MLRNLSPPTGFLKTEIRLSPAPGGKQAQTTDLDVRPEPIRNPHTLFSLSLGIQGHNERVIAVVTTRHVYAFSDILVVRSIPEQ